MNDKIRQLQQQIEAEEEKISRCKHLWGEPKYDPDKENKPFFSHYEPCGSDPYPVYIDRWVDRDRWSRKCSVCGTIQYSYKQEPVISGYKPKF